MKKVFLILLAMIGGLFLTMSIVIILMIGAVYGGTKDHKYSARDVKKYIREEYGIRDAGITEELPEKPVSIPWLKETDITNTWRVEAADEVFYVYETKFSDLGANRFELVSYYGEEDPMQKLIMQEKRCGIFRKNDVFAGHLLDMTMI